LSDNDVALISCDPYPGEIQAESVFGMAEKTNVTAIVFYSQQADYCNLHDFTGSFSWIYTTKSRAETTQLLDSVNSPDTNPDGQVYASIKAVASSQAVNGTGGGGGNNGGSNNHNSNPLGPSPSTAVAMIILYSITGIITALFLVIIITGAIRAHRHPERYGPRNITGRPRQSRARGLARAIVETLPIVKVGEQPEPKPADVELADTPSDRQQTTDRDATATQPTDDNTEQPQGEHQTRSRESVESGIAAAVNTSTHPDNLGCSICTEDFEAGQDQRVLPCDHRFHPECIDPWLLNVSGTCPLCRIDLRPQNTDSTDAGEADENGNSVLREGEFNAELAPPLNTEVTGERQRMGIRRSLLIGLMGARGADRMTQQERVDTARQLRRQHLAGLRGEQQSSGVEAETEEREQSRRARLRRVFGIRTRRMGDEPDGTEAESSSRNQGSPER
jgi:hypothetical protein